jgi:diguanylate cyclase (GGDEF)-like protein/PAS domain S-box-containing protein
LSPLGTDVDLWKLGQDENALGRSDRRNSNISPDMAATVFSYAREGIIVIDPCGRVMNVNEAFTRITGYEQDEVLGRELKSHGMVRRLEAFYAPMISALDFHGHWSGEVQSCHKDGRALTSRISISAVYGSHGSVQHYVALLSDMTQMKKRLELLERDARYDALTQLPNRLLLAERMRQALGQARTQQHRLAIAFIDLDGFKAINDNYGHELGDRVLQIIAKRIKATVREHDTLARLGGDEFVAGLVGLQQMGDCEVVLKRMLQAASAPIQIDAGTIEVSASIGVAFFPEHGQEIDALISKADQAMYLSKRCGGNRLAFCPA